ncbi:PQQ-dependent sugar dehydrogenase [Nocardioides sp. 1609]|uniref:PQQ-dependent sugar dehydrogenase n=1 Tax=Nocardioides sp. 1609 TaxID=2508327 RepID=UPI0010703A34|nr:PQQ-dependent sugar dehydrogenase [Nocardioides sp. 1609]
MRPVLVTTALLALAAPLLAVAPGGAGAATAPIPPAAVAAPSVASPSVTAPAAARAPSLRVTTRVGGLDHPWDVRRLPSGSLLVTERERARLTLSTAAGRKRTVRFPSRRIWTSGETGLMGLEVDPGFARNRRFYTCSGWRTGDGHDIRVTAWRLNRKETRARLVGPLLTGLPTTSGRHGGCRLLVTSDGALLVGTGDAAVGTNPRDLDSLGGKTLRLNRFTGRPWPQNPYAGSDNRNRRYVLTYGHRNVQGLAERRDGTLWSAEQGSYRDDEVNRLVPGGDYGWNPVPGYDESVPMTDQDLPGTQQDARWSSGPSTVATSGATFVRGRKWGGLNGALAVGVLKDQELLFIRFDADGFNPRVSTPAALDGRWGRLRSPVLLANGNLLVTTDNGDGRDRVLLVRPR